MLTYIIDGFNLFYQISSLKSSTNPHQDLLSYINRYKLTGSKNNKVIIVFDGYVDQPLCDFGFKIIFSYQDTADCVIKKLIDKVDKSLEVIIVSDDHEIKNFAKSKGLTTLSSKEFLKKAKVTKEYTSDKQISYTLQKEITEELKKIWLKED